MAKGTHLDEVSIVRFFEDGPIEKVEVVYNIVREKMRERLRARSPDVDESSARSAARKHSNKTNAADAASGGVTV